MNALFALALLASPSQATIVMPVEYVVAPAGPSAPVIPVLGYGAGPMTAPSFGAFDLRGGLPFLPSPVPGLGGPALSFIGPQDAAAVQPEPFAAQASPVPAKNQPGRPFEKAPAVPAKPASGGLTLAISRDRAAAAASPDSALSPPGARGDEADQSLRELARPEDASAAGRGFFDQSRENGLGAVGSGPASQEGPSLIAAAIPDGGMFGLAAAGAGRLAPANAVAAFGGGHIPSRDALSDAREGEALHDAVASAPGAFSPAVHPRVLAAYFPANTQNGGLGTPVRAPDARVAPASSVPRPLALDLSGSGLIVRVRSALHAVIAPVRSERAVSTPLVSGPSTALLERGAMLEAFSVSRAYAESESAFLPASSNGPRAARLAPLETVPGSAPSLWWAWLVLPLFIAAVRALP